MKLGEKGETEVSEELFHTEVPWPGGYSRASDWKMGLPVFLMNVPPPPTGKHLMAPVPSPGFVLCALSVYSSSPFLVDLLFHCLLPVSPGTVMALRYCHAGHHPEPQRTPWPALPGSGLCPDPSLVLCHPAAPHFLPQGAPFKLPHWSKLVWSLLGFRASLQRTKAS